MELGFGAGYAVDEFRAAGIPYPTVGDRVSWLEHLLVALRALLSGAVVDDPDTGIEGAVVGFPMVQDRLPFMVGGNGDRVLAIGSRHAEAVHLLGLTSGSTTVDPTPTHFGWEGLADRIAHVRRHTDGAPSFARAARLGLTPAQVLDSPFCLVGPTAAAAEHLGRLVEAGVSMVTVLEEHADAVADLRSAIGR
jgi:hypothetical protein